MFSSKVRRILSLGDGDSGRPAHVFVKRFGGGAMAGTSTSVPGGAGGGRACFGFLASLLPRDAWTWLFPFQRAVARRIHRRAFGRARQNARNPADDAAADP